MVAIPGGRGPNRVGKFWVQPARDLLPDPVLLRPRSKTLLSNVEELERRPPVVLLEIALIAAASPTTPPVPQRFRAPRDMDEQPVGPTGAYIVVVGVPADPAPEPHLLAREPRVNLNEDERPPVRRAFQLFLSPPASYEAAVFTRRMAPMDDGAARVQPQLADLVWLYLPGFGAVPRTIRPRFEDAFAEPFPRRAPISIGLMAVPPGIGTELLRRWSRTVRDSDDPSVEAIGSYALAIGVPPDGPPDVSLLVERARVQDPADIDQITRRAGMLFAPAAPGYDPALRWRQPTPLEQADERAVRALAKLFAAPAPGYDPALRRAASPVMAIDHEQGPRRADNAWRYATIPVGFSTELLHRWPAAPRDMDEPPIEALGSYQLVRRAAIAIGLLATAPPGFAIELLRRKAHVAALDPQAEALVSLLEIVLALPDGAAYPTELLKIRPQWRPDREAEQPPQYPSGLALRLPAAPTVLPLEVLRRYATWRGQDDIVILPARRPTLFVPSVHPVFPEQLFRLLSWRGQDEGPSWLARRPTLFVPSVAPVFPLQLMRAMRRLQDAAAEEVRLGEFVLALDDGSAFPGALFRPRLAGDRTVLEWAGRRAPYGIDFLTAITALLRAMAHHDAITALRYADEETTPVTSSHDAMTPIPKEPRMTITSGRITGYTTGDDVDVNRSVPNVPAGQTIVSARLTIKRALSDADPGVLQKSITASAVAGQGQVTNTGAGGTAAIHFELTATDTRALGTARYYYDVEVKTSGAKTYTTEEGFIQLGPDVTTS